MKNIKKILALMLALSMMFCLFGCGEGSSSGGGNKNTANVDFGGETITIILEYQPSDQYGIDASRDRELDRIKELNKKFNVNIEMKKGPSNYNEAIISSISSGTPVGHIIRVNGNKNYDFIRAGLCASLDDAMKKTGIDMTEPHYDQRTNKFYNVNGKQYIMSYFIPQESLIMDLWFYNKDILAELGYESNYINKLYEEGKWNWTTATQLFKKATKTAANGTVTRYGFGSSWIHRTTASLINCNGGAMGSVAADGSPKVSMSDTKVREAFQQMYDWGVVDKVMAQTESDESFSKFTKGEMFMLSSAAGRARQCYNAGMNFGVIYPPKGDSSTQKTTVTMAVGNGFIIPVTYQDMADKLLVLLDALYAEYEDASREDILKADQINFFSDKESWNVLKTATLDTSIQTNDPFTAFNLEWVDPAFGTVCKNLVKGTDSPGGVVEKYNDQYQALLDDLFKECKLTGVNK
ncbi:MAG: extracellular solute-binding protein [Clostridia bacterium]|nr:extracellular solute-binding protein [Clostridia bacterium]